MKLLLSLGPDGAVTTSAPRGAQPAIIGLAPRAPTRPGLTACAWLRRREKQGGDDGSAFGEQDVVGAAGRRGVHRLDADARRRSAGRSSEGAAKRRRAPLPKITSSGRSARQAPKCAAVERLEASARPRERRRRCHGTTTLCGVLDAVDEHAVGPVAGDRVLALDAVGAHFHDVIIGGGPMAAAAPGKRASRRNPCGQISGCPRAFASRSLPRATSSQVEQARQRLLRHPRPGPREGAADGGRGPARSSSSTSATSPRSGSSRRTRSSRT